MKELKTLKDLRKELKKLNNPNEEYLLGIRDFERWTKAEAIKIYKAIKNGDLVIDAPTLIRWFANLTEEHLK